VEIRFKLKTKQLVALLVSISLVLMLVLSACGQNDTTTTPSTTSSQTETQQLDKIYKVLNPSGIPSSVDCKGLSPRLDSLAGKRILFYQSEATNMQLPTLLERLKSDYPTATFDTVYSASFGEDSPSEEQMTYDACIRGVAW